MRTPSLPFWLLALIASAGAWASSAATGPRIGIDPTTFAFGKVLQNKTLHKDFVIRNLGTEDLKIGRISTTCGCTAALAESDVVKPGSSTTLGVDLQTRTYSGRVERSVIVESNDPTKPRLELVVSATVVAQ